MSLYFETLSSVREMPAQAWNSLLPTRYPFLRHEYLLALEESQCTGGNTGWQAEHIVGYREGERSRPAVIVPSYIKTHSYGEYVFDWSWARAYQRAGLLYYPKLVQCAPFAPATGPRILCGAGTPDSRDVECVAQYLKKRCETQRYSGCHLLFPEQALSEEFERYGFERRLGVQFHWRNQAYRDWQDFLATFASRKRKNVQKERRGAQSHGLDFETLEGHQLQPRDWDAIYAFYRATYEKRSGHAGYLTHRFFSAIGEKLAESVVVTVARRGTQWVAAALAFRDESALYGRFWGCLEELDGLHFELCYYRFLEYAIAHGLARFDPGAQGEHKIARGFAPTLTYSNHWIADPQARASIHGFLRQEALEVVRYANEAATLLPFRCADDGDST